MTSTLCHDYRSWFRNPDQDSAGPQAANLDPEQAEAHARSCASCGSLSAAYSSSVEAVKESYSAPLSRDAEDAFMAEALRRFQPTRSKRISKLTELLRIPGSWRIPAPVQLARPLAFAFGAAMMLVLLVQALHVAGRSQGHPARAARR